MKRLFFIVPPVVLFILFLAVSCSTVKVIPDGEYRLRKNKITVVNSTKIKEVELLPYVRQKPNSEFLFGWNPFLSIYNWSNEQISRQDPQCTRNGRPGHTSPNSIRIRT